MQLALYPPPGDAAAASGGHHTLGTVRLARRTVEPQSGGHGPCAYGTELLCLIYRPNRSLGATSESNQRAGTTALSGDHRRRDMSLVRARTTQSLLMRPFHWRGQRFSPSFPGLGVNGRVLQVSQPGRQHDPHQSHVLDE